MAKGVVWVGKKCGVKFREKCGVNYCVERSMVWIIGRNYIRTTGHDTQQLGSEVEMTRPDRQRKRRIAGRVSVVRKAAGR